jgi:hypothetical protein
LRRAVGLVRCARPFSILCTAHAYLPHDTAIAPESITNAANIECSQLRMKPVPRHDHANLVVRRSMGEARASVPPRAKTAP